jgi:hypothetical protein
MSNKIMNWLLSAALVVGSGGCKKQESREPLERRTASAQIETQPSVELSRTEITEANKYLRAFPEQIYGARKIEKHEDLGAKYCSVHVKQTHFVQAGEYVELDDPVLKKFYEDQIIKPINSVQKDIADILISFISKGRRKIYSEGLCVSNTSSDSVIEYSIRNAHVAKKLGITSEEVMKKYPYVGGADYLLSATGKLKLLPADSVELNAIANRTKTNEDICDNREDYLLDVVVASGEPSSVVVYGGGHDFDDNIKRWNELHSDKKISLIEVTPKSYFTKGK